VGGSAPIHRGGPVERFRASLQELGFEASSGERLAVAVSGGADSAALLLLAHEALGGRVAALTVDHRLRREGASEAALVAKLCTSLGVAHATLRWEFTQRPSSNLQSLARDARYALMGGWCVQAGVAYLATAHHADDQAETLLLRLARGSGLAGLAGVRARRPLRAGVTLLRPLLQFRRSELAAYCADNGVSPVEDPTNRDPAFDRTQARAFLARGEWPDPRQLARSAAHLADAEEALDWATGIAWRGRVRRAGAGSVIVDPEGLPREIARRLLARAIAEVPDAVPPRGGDVARLVDRLARGETGCVGGAQVTPQTAGGRMRWKVAPEAVRGKAPLA
jgi:tRNA(Ile)-lysidine synthase